MTRDGLAVRRSTPTLIVGLLLTLVLSGCSLFFGGRDGEPPLASINGVPGHLGSYCWDGTCADAAGPPDPSTLRAVSAPLTLAVPHPVDTIKVFAWGPGGPDAASVEVGLTDGVIDPIPADTVMVSVGVWFAGGGDAGYYWAIGERADGAEGEASPTP